MTKQDWEKVKKAEERGREIYGPMFIDNPPERLTKKMNRDTPAGVPWEAVGEGWGPES